MDCAPSKECDLGVAKLTLMACLLAGELKTGYLEKRVGEHSGRQSVPLGESFKWQKRYFVLTEPKGMLYYFKSADDPPNYRGVINLR